MSILPCVLFVTFLLFLATQCTSSGTYRGVSARAATAWRELSYHREGTQHVQSYLSAPYSLQAGEVVFTDPERTILRFPTTPAMIQSFRAEIVDDDGTSVPLFETYNHHWIVMKNGGENNLGPCHDSLPYVFGVGEECRNTFVQYPGNYRLFTDGTETWTANIHMMRTVNVPYVKQCIECHCGNVTDPYAGGNFHCCPDGSFCPTDDKPKPPPKNYYLKYTIYYDDSDPKFLPVNVLVFDSSYCQVEYNVPPCTNPQDGCVVSRSQRVKLAWDVDIIYTVGHIHPGSINITLSASSMSTPICVSFPRYGNGTTAGNENGYVVALNPCVFETPLHLKKGTIVTATGYYNSSTWHDAVMSLFYVAIAGSDVQSPFLALN